jgi:hypothetical protein
MPTQKQLAACELYANLMDEAKTRFGEIKRAVSGELRFSQALVREFGFLQLRFLCELIALVYLVAHGDIEATQQPRLKKQHKADLIIDALDKLHGDFYPYPVVFAPAAGQLNLIDTTRPRLEKMEVAKLYGRCGDYLHRGTLKTLRTSWSHIALNSAQADFPEIARWTNKIIGLLDQHRIALKGHRAFMIVALNDLSVGGRDSVAFAEAAPLVSPTVAA